MTRKSITSVAVIYQNLPNDLRDKQRQLPNNIIHIDAKSGHTVPGEDL